MSGTRGAGPTAGFNFLEQPALPAPQVSEQQAVELLAAHFGVAGRVKSLGSQQNCNFLVLDADDTDAADDEPIAVLKIANPAFTETELQAQDAAAELIARAEPALRVATPMPTAGGEKYAATTGSINSYVRLLPYLAGGTLTARGYLAPPVVAAMGELAGRVSRVLAGFAHPGLDRARQRDLRFGQDVVTELIAQVPAHRDALRAAATGAWARITALAGELPRQAVHLDLTDANVIAAPSGLPDGIIDFGDLCDTWAVSELAITLSSVLGHPGNDPTSILPGIKAFHAVRPLLPAEARALWPLLVLRTAVLIVTGAQQAALDPGNAYLTEQTDDEWRMFHTATSVPIDVMTALITAELGAAVSPPAVEVENRLISGLDPDAVVTLDLSDTATSTPDELAAAAVAGGAAFVLTRFGGPQPDRAPLLSQRSPDVVATGISLWPASTTRVLAPWDGEIIDRSDDRVTLRGLDVELTLTGVESTGAPGNVHAGEHLGVVAPGRWVQLAARPAGAPVAPQFTSAELAPGWLALSRDPRPVLGLDPLAEAPQQTS